MAPKRVCPLAASVELLGRVTGGRFARPGNPRTKYETCVCGSPEPRYRPDLAEIPDLIGSLSGTERSFLLMVARTVSTPPIKLGETVSRLDRAGSGAGPRRRKSPAALGDHLQRGRAASQVRPAHQADDSLEPVLNAVGPRLRTLRQQRGGDRGRVRRRYRHFDQHPVATGVRSAATNSGPAAAAGRAHRVALGEPVGRTDHRRPAHPPATRGPPWHDLAATDAPARRHASFQADRSGRPRPRAAATTGVSRGYEWLYVLSGEPRVVSMICR